MKSLEQIEKKIHGKRNKKTKKAPSTEKKVNYQWLRHSYSCKVKAYLAFLTDNSGSTDIHTPRKKKLFFETVAYPKTMKRFPKIYKIVRKYYRNRGRSLSSEEFKNLLYARLLNMYGKTFGILSKEHPLKTTNDNLSTYYRLMSKN